MGYNKEDGSKIRRISNFAFLRETRAKRGPDRSFLSGTGATTKGMQAKFVGSVTRTDPEITDSNCNPVRDVGKEGI